MAKKLVKELKWLAVSAVIVTVAISTLYGITYVGQWSVDRNMARVEAGQAELVPWR